MKRLFDLFFSSLGLLVLSPVLLVLYVLIRSDGGPAFFCQQRMGYQGRIFYVFKLRSMVVNADKMGSQVTAASDPRITRIGSFLRKTKLDELPQLVNVLRGDMSLVGPRPEVPYYVQKWPDADRELILSVQPGITDYATLYYSDEQAVLAQAEDREKAYLEDVLPHKLSLYRQYVRDQSLWLDFRLIIATLLKMLGIKPDVLIGGRKNE